MKRESNTDISFFQRYLTLWVIVCMVLGVLIGKYLPGIPAFLNQFEYAKVSIPMAILIWLMIYPMMMKVDFHTNHQLKCALHILIGDWYKPFRHSKQK